MIRVNTGICERKIKTINCISLNVYDSDMNNKLNTCMAAIDLQSIGTV